MPLLDNPKRITQDEFGEDDKDVAERIGNYYNFFVEQATNIINGNIDFDNLNRDLITLEFTVDGSGIPIQNTRFSADIGIKGMSVINATNLTNLAVYPTGSPLISFTGSGTGVYTINHVTGLPASNKFRLVIEVIY
jgi:hypothetical protein